MINFKLGEKEQYDIGAEFAENYKITEGTISPFTRLKVVIVEGNKGEIDIKRPRVDKGVDIKKISSDDSDVDIKKPSPKEEIDIKKVQE